MNRVMRWLVPVDVAAVLKALAMLGFVIVVIMSLQSAASEKSNLREQIDDDKALTSCRAKLTASVTDAQSEVTDAQAVLFEAQATHDLGFSRLVVSLGAQAGEAVATDIAHLVDVDRTYRAAVATFRTTVERFRMVVSQRVEFEEQPSAEACAR